MSVLLASIALSLTEILGLTKDVRGDSFVVLYSLLDDDGLRVLLLVALWVQSKSGSIEHPLLTIAESVISWVELPVVVSLLLLSWRIISMSLPVHSSCRWVISDEGTSNWVEHLLGALETLAGHTEFHLATLSFLGPIILSLVTLTEGLLHS